MTDQHDPRCERSASDPQRCRCHVCKGARHGEFAAPIDLGHPMTYRELGDALKRASQQLTARVDATLAELAAELAEGDHP